MVLLLKTLFMSQSNTHSEIDQVIHRLGLKDSWHKSIATELEQCTMQFDDISNQADRTDFRQMPFVTIDGADAKDFDDAICCQQSDDGIILWVAIADVAEYVRVGSALDKEAFKRGNSTYLPDRVLPMLPPLLSNNLCSLLPDEDRPVIVCRMVIDQQAQLAEYCFSKALIRSRCRLTYNQVQDFFDKGSLIACTCAEVSSMLQTAAKLYRALRKSRQQRGALNLDIPQRQLHFDKNQRIVKVVPQMRSDAHCMIEEFMVCANIAAARYLSSQDLCFLSRVHEGFKKEALPILNNFLRSLGFRLTGSKDQEFQNLVHLIEQTADHPNKQIIHMMILSSLQRAIYAPSKQGHFGLALTHYTHFTSPIRRYPDLSVHRAIHASLNSTVGHLYSLNELKAQGRHCSMTERLSDDAVRDIEQYFLCMLAQTKKEQIYSGVITAVVAFGLFVELTELQTSGLVHIRSLKDDYYRFNDTQQYLKGVRRGKSYKIGQTIKVAIKSACPAERKIDLLLVNS